MKRIIYPVLLLILSSFTLFSCSSSDNELDLTVDNEWTVIERSFECEYENYGKEVTTFFGKAIQDGYVYNLTFGPFVAEPASYLEDVSLKVDDELIPEKSFAGTYIMNADKRTMTVTLPTTRGDWKFDTRIVDHNKEFIFFEQQMTSNDIENMFLLYFGIIRHLDDGITGVLKTKATKIKQ